MARFSNLWDEAEHPRDRLGRFRNKWKIGGKAKAILDAILDRFNPKTFPDFQRANNYGVERGWSRYTPEQKKAITSYIKGDFKAIDAELKQGKSSPESQAIDSAMHPLEDDLILTRSFSPERFGLAANDAQAAEELTGKLIASKTYQNAWMGPASNNGGIQMHILAPRGTPAAFFGGAEVGLSRDQPLRITRAEKVPDGSIRLYAVAVPHGTAGNARPTHDVPGAVQAGRAAGNAEAGVPQENIPGKLPTPNAPTPERATPNPRAGEITPPSAPARDLGDTPSGIEADGRPSWTHGGAPIELTPATGSPGGGGITAKAGNQTLIQDAPDMESLAVEADRAGLPEVAKWARANQRFVKGSDAPAAGQRAAQRAALARQEASAPSAPEPNVSNAPAPNAPAAPSEPVPSPTAVPAAPTPTPTPQAPTTAPAPQAPSQPATPPTPVPAAAPAPTAAVPGEPAPLPTPVEPAPAAPAAPTPAAPAVPPTPSSSPQVPVDISQPVPADATPEVRAAHAEALRKAGEDAALQNPPTPVAAPAKAARVARVKKALAPAKAAPAPVAAPPAPVATEPPSTMPAKKVAKAVAKKAATKAVKATPEPAKKAAPAAPEKAVKKAAVKAVKATPEKVAAKKAAPAVPEKVAKKAAIKAAPAKRVAKPKLTPVQEAQQNAEHDVANREQRKVWSDAIPGGEPKDLRELEKTQLDQTAEFVRTKKWSKKRAVEELRGFARNRSDTHAAYLNKVADFIETSPRAPRKAAVKKVLNVPSTDSLRGISNSEERLKALDGLDLASLRKIASEAGVPGRSKLAKEALKKAISDHLGATKAEAPAKAVAKKAAVKATKVVKKAAPAVKAAAPEVKAVAKAAAPEVKAVAKAVKAVQPAKKRAPAGSMDDFLARDAGGAPLGDRVAARMIQRETPENQQLLLSKLSPEHRAAIDKAIAVNAESDRKGAEAPSVSKAASKAAKKAVKATTPVAPLKIAKKAASKSARDLTFSTPEDIQKDLREGKITAPAAVKRLRQHAAEMRQWAAHAELGSTMGRGVTENSKPSTTSGMAEAESKRRRALAAEYDRIANDIEGKATPVKATKAAPSVKAARQVPDFGELAGMKSREEVHQRLDSMTLAELKQVAKEGEVIHSASVLKPRLKQLIADKAVGDRLSTQAILGTSEADREAARVAAVARARTRKAAAAVESPVVPPVKKVATKAAKTAVPSAMTADSKKFQDARDKVKETQDEVQRLETRLQGIDPDTHDADIVGEQLDVAREERDVAESDLAGLRTQATAKLKKAAPSTPVPVAKKTAPAVKKAAAPAVKKAAAATAEEKSASGVRLLAQGGFREDKSPGVPSRADLMDPEKTSPGDLKDLEDRLGVERTSLAREERVNAILEAKAGAPPAKKTAAQRLAAFKAADTAKSAAPSAPEAPKPPAAPVTPAKKAAKKTAAKAVQKAESSTGAIQAGKFSDKPIPKNQWGTGSGEIHYHPDGVIGREVGRLGEDRKLDVDGLPLETVLGHIATDTVSGKTNTNEMLAKLRALQGRLPEGSRAKSAVTHMIAEIDEPKSSPIHVPAGTPGAMKDLTKALADIPLARKPKPDGTTELAKLARIMDDFEQGKVGGLRLIREVESLHNGRHESVEGKLELDRAVQAAVTKMQALYKDAKTRSQLVPPKKE